MLLAGPEQKRQKTQEHLQLICRPLAECRVAQDRADAMKRVGWVVAARAGERALKAPCNRPRCAVVAREELIGPFWDVGAGQCFHECQADGADASGTGTRGN